MIDAGIVDLVAAIMSKATAAAAAAVELHSFAQASPAGVVAYLKR